MNHIERKSVLLPRLDFKTTSENVFYRESPSKEIEIFIVVAKISKLESLYQREVRYLECPLYGSLTLQYRKIHLWKKFEKSFLWKITVINFSSFCCRQLFRSSKFHKFKFRKKQIKNRSLHITHSSVFCIIIMSLFTVFII